MNTKYPKLLRPITLAGLTLKNRIFSAPTSLSELGPDTKYTREGIEYYKLRAAGGAAVVCVGEVIVDLQNGKSHPEQIGITNRFLSTLGGAPVCLLVFMLKPDYPDRDGAMQSVSAAIENVLLAAWAKGIGSCWLSAPQRMGFGPAFQRRFAPDKGEFVAAVTLGYPDQQPKMPPRRDGRYLIV